MPRYKFFLPSFPDGINKAKLLAYLKSIREDAERNNNQVSKATHIEDLKYFLRFIYAESERIIAEIDIDNSSFFVALPPNPRNSYKCFWVKDDQNKIHFSTTQNGLLPPSPENNFYRYFTYLIQEFKNKIKKIMAKQQGMAETAHLWHTNPTTKEIIDEFIAAHNLNNKLENVISPNGLGNNLPFLMPEYAYLRDEILNFYIEKAENKSLGFELRQYVRQMP
ncbi:MAG: hypothetical protein Q4D86_09905 [Pasteurella oralis]|uniref:hypothetical protein n=1 Tax=Pasteurella oralis TaxID=1071947 RepID=UPI0026FF9A03|nr:hypothetical protein [Pasteurella oralis]